jgi:hypothetical protein
MICLFAMNPIGNQRCAMLMSMRPHAAENEHGPFALFHVVQSTYWYELKARFKLRITRIATAPPRNEEAGGQLVLEPSIVSTNVWQHNKCLAAYVSISIILRKPISLWKDGAATLSTIRAKGIPYLDSRCRKQFRFCLAQNRFGKACTATQHQRIGAIAQPDCLYCVALGLKSSLPSAMRRWGLRSISVWNFCTISVSNSKEMHTSVLQWLRIPRSNLV